MAGLTDRAAEPLLALPLREEALSAGEILYRPGASGLPCCILLQGSAIRYKLRDDGSRAVVAFELPGDIVNLEALLLGQTDCGVTVTTQSVVAFIPSDVMAKTWKTEPGLEAALWRYAFVKSAALEEWLLNIGKRPPTGRVAHLLMELRSRLIAVDNPAIDTSAIHATTQDIADAMGLQEVIAIRIINELASQDILRRDGDVILINDANRLAKIGEFRPDYLHMAT